MIRLIKYWGGKKGKKMVNKQRSIEEERGMRKYSRKRRFVVEIRGPPDLVKAVSRGDLQHVRQVSRAYLPPGGEVSSPSSPFLPPSFLLLCCCCCFLSQLRDKNQSHAQLNALPLLLVLGPRPFRKKPMPSPRFLPRHRHRFPLRVLSRSRERKERCSSFLFLNLKR